MSAVEVHNLFKDFSRGGRGRKRRHAPALDDVSFEIGRGECVSILGRNGSGKSTLVRILSTLILPDGGSARLFGHDVVAEGAAVRRFVNRVSVEASFFKRMSAVENLSYSARFYGIGLHETRVRIPEILDRVGFPSSRRNARMDQLSRGTQQKVALARALLTSPVILLLDEPTTGLDPRSKLEVQDFIKTIHDAHDTTILLCTHDMREAEILSDRIGILEHGRLLHLDGVEGLLERFGAETVEDAFLAATGHSVEDSWDQSGELEVTK
jgi:ABC-2 type transport system ATP-binding protein